MRKINNTICIALIVTLIGLFLSMKSAYSSGTTSLRAPLQINKERTEEAIVDVEKTKELFQHQEISRILDEIEYNQSLIEKRDGKEYIFYDYMLKLKLLHALGILKGNVFYPCWGIDYFISYFTKTFGINSEGGLGFEIKDIKSLEKEMIREGLLEAYENMPKDIVMLKGSVFKYRKYFSKLKKAGGVDVLFLKEVTQWIEVYQSFPGAKRFFSSKGDIFQKKLRGKIQDIISKMDRDVINNGAYIIIVRKYDMWLSDFIMSELGYTDLLEEPGYERLGDVLAEKSLYKETGIMYKSIKGNKCALSLTAVPIRIFQKPLKPKEYSAKLGRGDRAFLGYIREKIDRIVLLRDSL